MVKRKIKVIDIVIIALMTAITVVCSLISLPLGAVPVTFQTFAVCICSGLLGWKKGTLSVMLYLLLGVAGLPVFSGFQGGVSALLGPTGGFALGFVPMSILSGIIIEKAGRKISILLIAYFSGLLICYAIGLLWYMLVYSVGKVGFSAAFSVCILPFIIPDAVKILLAVAVTRNERLRYENLRKSA